MEQIEEMDVVRFLVIFILPFNISKHEADGEELETTLHVIKKRNLWNFAKVIQCAHGKTDIFPFWALERFNEYGCHCGYGGNGKVMDETDRCCYRHDRCWGEVRKKHNTAKFNLYVGHYDYRCYNGKVYCNDKVPWKRDLCNCDRVCAVCMKKSSHSYDDSMKHLDSGGHCHK